MKVSIATSQDNEELKGFYESFVVEAPLSLHLKRSSHFSDYYRLQSEDFETHILKDKNGSIQGCATLLFRQGQLANTTTTVGYATDLRIAPTREAIVNWTRHFLPIIKKACQKRNVPYLFSTIPESYSGAHNTLVRRRAQRRHIPIYSLVRKLDIVTILGHLPFFSHPLKTIRLARADQNDIEALVMYLKRQSSKRALAFPYSVDFLQQRFNQWPGLQIESFILAKDRRQNIIGCVAPWSLAQVQRFIVAEYGGFASTAKTALKVGSWFNISNILPPVGGELPIEFLTHLYADNPDVFTCLLEESYRVRSPHSVLVYPHFYDFPQTEPSKPFLFSTSPLGLYMISTRDANLPQELLYNPVESPPELELCLI